MNALRQRLTVATLLIVISFGVVFVVSLRPPQDPDMYWHLAMARQQWEQGHRWESDSFSHTIPGKEWNNAFWLGHYPYYGLYLLAGDLGLVAYVAILALAGMTLLYFSSEGDPAARAFGLILAAVTASITWTARPQMISFALCALIVYLLGRYRDGSIKHLWWLLPVFALWPNLHGGYALGFFFMALAMLGEGLHWLFEGVIQPEDPTPTLRPMIHIGLVGLASALCIVVFNPYGIEAITYPFYVLNMEASRSFIIEWQSPDFGLATALPQLLLLMATIGAVGLSGEKADWRDLMLALGFTYLSFTSWRVVLVYPLAITPLLVRHLSCWIERLGLDLQWHRAARGARLYLNAGLGLLILAGTAMLAIDRLRPDRAEEALRSAYPVDAVAWLRANPQPRELYNHYNWGGYLVWTLPEMPVYIDGRADLYGDELVSEFAHVNSGAGGWEETLENRAIRTALVEHGSGLARAMAAQPENWRLVYEDAQALIYVRLP